MFSVYILIYVSCVDSGSSRVEFDYVGGDRFADKFVNTFRDGRIVSARPRNASDTFRIIWYAENLDWRYSDSTKIRVSNYLKEKLNLPVNEYGTRGFLPGWVLISSKNARNRDALVTYSGLVPVPEDARMPGVPVSQFGANELYLYRSVDSAIIFIGRDAGDTTRKRRDVYDSLFDGLRNPVFDENNGRIYYSVNGKARCYQPSIGTTTNLNQYDGIVPVRNSNLLLGYSFENNGYTLLDSTHTPSVSLKGPVALEIISAHFLDSANVVIMLRPRSDPARPRLCYHLNFLNGSYSHLIDFPDGEIIDAKMVTQ